MFTRPLLSLLALAALAPRAGAQSTALDSVRLRASSDSTAEARVLQHAWEILAPWLHAASLDSVSRPWTIVVPGDRILPWSRAAAHMRTALRARAESPGDTTVYTLTVFPVEISPDSAWTRIQVDVARRCGPDPVTTRSQLGGFGNVHQVMVPRMSRGGMWGAARTRSVAHGDRARCAPR